MLNTKTKKVTGFWGAGIPLSFGKVVDVYTETVIFFGMMATNKTSVVGNQNGIGIYWGVEKKSIPFSSYWDGY